MIRDHRDPNATRAREIWKPSGQAIFNPSQNAFAILLLRLQQSHFEVNARFLIVMELYTYTSSRESRAKMHSEKSIILRVLNGTDLRDHNRMVLSLRCDYAKRIQSRREGLSRSYAVGERDRPGRLQAASRRLAPCFGSIHLSVICSNSVMPSARRRRLRSRQPRSQIQQNCYG